MRSLQSAHPAIRGKLAPAYCYLWLDPTFMVNTREFQVTVQTIK